MSYSLKCLKRIGLIKNDLDLNASPRDLLTTGFHTGDAPGKEPAFEQHRVTEPLSGDRGTLQTWRMIIWKCLW